MPFKQVSENACSRAQAAKSIVLLDDVCQCAKGDSVDLHSAFLGFFCYIDMAQYQTVGDIPDAAFKRNDVIYGTVEKMVDGDTFRVR